MTGVSEILVLILLISGILILPRMFKPTPKTLVNRKPFILSTKMRVGIVLSVLVPLMTALMLKPWKSHLILYIFIGIVPVALAWAFVWIQAGQKK